jgi:outer membrane protein, multidrug efflux system
LERFPDTEQKKKNASTFTCSILLVLPSCGIPDLRRADPGPDRPGGFKGATRLENSSQVGIEEFFDDPMLMSLIDRALAGNRGLKILAQDVLIAGDEIPARRGAYLPFVTIGDGAGLDKPDLDTPEEAVEEPTRTSLTERSRKLQCSCWNPQTAR